MFRKTVKIDPDFGDSWAYFYKFERVQGTREKQEEVKTRCVAAAPKHGEFWCRTAKNILNFSLSIDKVLDLVHINVPHPDLRI